MIEVDDVLPDCVQQAIDEVESMLKSFCEDEDPDEVPCLFNDLDYSGDVHEVVDNAVPIWDSQIDAAWFLHGRDLETAYENAGVGDNPRENDGKAAIYYYIQQEVSAWYDKNAARIWNLVRQGRD
jgi:hypothetical protein